MNFILSFANVIRDTHLVVCKNEMISHANQSQMLMINAQFTSRLESNVLEILVTFTEWNYLIKQIGFFWKNVRKKDNLKNIERVF